MPLHSTSKTSPSAFLLMEECCRSPWKTWQRPFRMAPGVYYVSGNNWVASYLLDTGDGLVLIDTGMHETVYLLIESVRMLGFDIRNIRKILLTHAHIDHIGGARALKELTGAKLYLGRRDLLFLHERRDLIGGEGQYTCGLFEPDELYDDARPICQGNLTIHSVSTPGHTPGCTSFYFDVQDAVHGRTLRCAIHGGVGLNLKNSDFEKTGLPHSLRDEFIAGLEKLDKWHVDVTLPSHTNQYGILPLVDQISEEYNPFYEPGVWHELMNERLERVREIVKAGI